MRVFKIYVSLIANTLVAGILLSLLPMKTFAESDTVTWLTTTPVSLMAWGLDRLERLIRKQIEIGDHIAPNVSATFQIEDETIVVSFVAFNDSISPDDRSVCHSAIEEGKGLIGFSGSAVDVAQGKETNSTIKNHMYDDPLKYLAQLFAGYGYDVPNQPHDLGRKVADMILIKVDLNNFKIGKKLSCKSRLLSHDVEYFQVSLP